MRRWHIAVLFSLLASSLPSSLSAEMPKPDYPATSALLFPETSSWAPVTIMKRLDKAYFDRIKTQLRDAYIASKVNSHGESAQCSFIGSVLPEELPKDQNYLFVYDVDADGQKDIIYTGGMICGEGHSTLIWLGSKEGFHVTEESYWDVLAIRIKPGKPTLLSSVVPGCCGDRIDTYHIGPLYNVRNYGTIKIKYDTVLPKNVGAPKAFLANSGELVLRSSPKRDDRYDLNDSRFQGVAVFGNVLTKFLPGCEGRIVGRHLNTESKIWYFVILNGGCHPLRTLVSYDVVAGWVEGESVIVK